MHDLTQQLEFAQTKQQAASRANQEYQEASKPLVAAVLDLVDKHEKLFSDLHDEAHQVGLYPRSFEDSYGQSPYNAFESPVWKVSEDRIVVSGKYYAGCGEHDFGWTALPLKYLASNGERQMEDDAKALREAVALKEAQLEKARSLANEIADREQYEHLRRKFEGNENV